MNHSPADIIRRLLISLGQGTLPSSNSAWPIYAHNLPDTPDNAIVLYDTQGELHGRSGADGGVMDEHHGLEVMVRSSSTNTGGQKVRDIADALDQQVHNDEITLTDNVGTTTTTYNVVAVTRKSGPLYLGTDTPDSMRYLFTLNSIVAIRQED